MGAAFPLVGGVVGATTATAIQNQQRARENFEREIKEQEAAVRRHQAGWVGSKFAELV